MPDTNIFEKAVAFTLTIGKLGIRRKVKSESIHHDADPDMVKVAKEILDCEEYNKISSLDSKIRTQLQTLSLPLKRGIYLVPFSMVPQTDALMEKYKTEREELITKFLGVYMEAAEAARSRLGSLYNLADYPPVEEVKASFYVHTQYVSFGVPNALEQINSDLWRREREKAERTWQDAAEEIKQVLRAAMAELVSHLLDRLNGSREDGRPSIFKQASVDNLNKFFETFEPRNVADDRELAELVQQAKSVIGGVDAARLRSSDDLRREVVVGMTSVKEKLDGMLTVRPRRRLVFNEEEVAN